MQGFRHGDLRWEWNTIRFTAFRRAAKALALVIVATFLGYVASVALRETWDWSAFSEPMLVKLEQWPVVFRIHMVTGGLALLLAPLTFLLRGTRWHRRIGRIAAADVAIAAITALPVALETPVTRVAAAGFSTQGVVWFALLASGIWSIRRGDRAAHRACMAAMMAVTSGALFFRLYLSLWSLTGARASFKLFYSCDAWAAWTIPLAATLAWLAIERRHACQAWPRHV